MTDTSVFEHKTAAYYTLGCKLNFAETSQIGRSLLEQGVRTARAGERASICVINTCSVTELADKKCRYMIRRAHREHPGAFIVVTGCYAQLKPEDVGAIEGVNLVLGAEQKLDVVRYLSDLGQLDLGVKEIVSGGIRDVKTFYPSLSSDERTRYFLKVQDGCNYHCTYCTIPKARGRSRNASVSELVEQAREIARAGGKEIVLTGVNIGDFGRSTGESFLDLLRGLDSVEGICRYRIGSVEPNLLTEEIIDFCAHAQRIAPHFHIPLQSGSDEVLRLMRRRYDTELFAQRVAYIRSVLPSAFIGVDVIVGSRGELAELYEESYAFVESLPISELHVFSYSERSGTEALQIPHIVSPEDKHKRSQRLQRLSERKIREFYQAQVGSVQRVLWERGCDDEGLMTGLSDNYLRVARAFDINRVGRMEVVLPTSLHPDKNYLVV